MKYISDGEHYKSANNNIIHASRYVYLLRVPSSVQQPSATVSKYVFYSMCSFCLCHLYPTPSRNSLFFYSSSIFFFRSFFFSGGVFFLLCSRTRYASTWFAYLDSLAFGFSLSHSLWPQNLYLKDEESGRTLGVLLMSLGTKNGLMWRQQQQQQGGLRRGGVTPASAPRVPVMPRMYDICTIGKKSML